MSKLIKKSKNKKQRTKFKVSTIEIASPAKCGVAMTKSGLFILAKKIKNNFIVYYLILANASPRKLAPYYHTFIYTLIRKTARPIINFEEKIARVNFKKLKISRAQFAGYLPRLTKRGISVVVIIAIVFVQVMNVGAFEAHVINVTAKIVNDVPLIEPNGGEFCNITGATITITSTLIIDHTIIYTTNGSDPVCPSTGNLYTIPFPIYQTATVKARTCHDEKQSAVMAKHFDVAGEFCPVSSCNAETISYWQNNQGCENDPKVSQQVVQINNLSLNNFQGAFATVTGEQICASFDLTSCPPENTLAGELCRAKGETLADLSNIVTGKLDLNAVIAGAFDNSLNFTNLNLTASSTTEEALNKIEAVLINPSATQADLANAKFVAQRIYIFYNSENPYAPEPTCIYYEPGNVVLNELVPNPSCSTQPEDVVIVMDTSGSMGDDSPTRLYQAKTAANEFINNMQTNDQSALVSYATTASLNKTLSNNHASTTAVINSLTAVGATDIGDAINLANNELISVRANPLSTKVEILLTDGMANRPSGPGFGEWPADVAYAKAKADEAAAQGIKIFTIGLGTSVNTVMMQYIASTTGAQYHFAPNGAALEAIYKLISKELCGAGDNDQNLKGLAGEWAELYNKGNIQYDLANWIIANAATSTTVKVNTGNTFSGLTTVGAAGSGNEWQVVLFNGARLNNFGDTIFLYDNIGHLLDFYSYASSIDNDPDSDPANTPGASNTLDGNLAGQEGKSFARIPDGVGGWVDPIPTPGGSNKLEIDLTVTDKLINDIATSSAEDLPAQPENNNQNNNNLAGSDNDDSQEPLIPAAAGLNSGDQPMIDLPVATSTATSTLDLISAEQNPELNQPTEENNGEPISPPDQVIIEPGDETASLSEEAQTEPLPDPGEEKPAVIDAPKEQAVEPAVIPTEATPNSENTTL